MKLADFLETKPLYYDKIDLSRMPRAYAMVRPHLNLGEVVHLVGTNGKGSTGRILASLLKEAGYRVGHYSSPHILRFNERIWIDGADAEDRRLEAAHRTLMSWLGSECAEELSYFEYTTLLALTAFEGCDFVVFEAGLGGEFDATNVVDKVLSVVTPIGIDHQAFLGDSITQIAETKIRSIQKEALVAPQPAPEVYETAKRIAKAKGARLLTPEGVLGKAVRRSILDTAVSIGWPLYLGENAVAAFAAAKRLTHRDYDPEMLASIQLKGRFERILPNVILDVGHNPLGARAVAEALDGRTPVLVYNALEDKDVVQILEILQPVIRRLEIIPIESERAIAEERLAEAAAKLGIEAGPFRGLREEEEYLVFGSFIVAEAFLKSLHET
ncbi:bifunctional folylpolyglutamate synthase/dihydrofolate synthase [Hydrogenimonas cancrithermarum]|uniref:Bifunctional folylpolyglutamate synthase/dihydrofolate synthase n=1 Tax=Hydrogenimonas cancrithermarum TaxID=2993563 RepID=A0ABN6WW88_9BACT|nr:bifunctional folylpolyglutamate synthase/dihydrofolate synthase [Hydrogenimonas cancrithermarum]BDY13385.1 bifunctional folylpolyglutamate synthase/dihydrofolate synthase [Hydrogenimonas cancrithermarum]